MDWLNKRVPVLAYHRVVPEPLPELGHKIWVTVRSFNRQMRLLSYSGFKTISLDLLVSAAKGTTRLPEKPIIITFDDGYQDNYLYAFPILKKYNLTATIFLVSGSIGQTNHWDKGEPIKLLTAAEIREMADYGLSFGAHTVTHPHLGQLNQEEAYLEILQSKGDIEDLLGQGIMSFCYPYGNFNPTIKEMVIKAGFECACAVDTEVNDLYELRRRQVFPSTNLFGFWRKVQKWYDSYKRYSALLP